MSSVSRSLFPALALALLLALPACAADKSARSAESASQSTVSESPAPAESTGADAAVAPDPAPAPAAVSPATSGIVGEMVLYHAVYGEEADQKVNEMLDELTAQDEMSGVKWRAIMDQWYAVNDVEVNYDVLPDGLPTTDELCIVVLGFRLNPDGSMQDELLGRLEVARASAEKYPQALVVCTGGGTAHDNPEVTEAGSMAAWLVENGVDSSRVLVEDHSRSTSQNAQLTYGLLKATHPQVSKLAIVSSDYHIPTANLIFGAEATLEAPAPGQETFSVISNAACPAIEATPRPPLYQAGALTELAGNVETAFEIYGQRYDLSTLPPLE